MESENLFFDRGMVLWTRRILAFGAMLLFSTSLLLSQNNNQTVSLDENGEALLNIESLDDCFTSTICIPSRAVGDGHAVWLSNNTFPGSSTDFLFDAGVILEENADGTATITGTLYNTTNPTDKWEVALYLADRKNWSDWSALGRSYKDEKGLAGSNYLDWNYYIMDLTQVSKLTGIGANAGKTLVLQHAPASYLYGFQVGTAANNKNSSYGFSGWFMYSWNGVNYHQGDFNLDLDCPEREVTYTYDSEFDCDDLGDNTVEVISTDQYGNTCTQEIIVTVRDVTPPTVVTKNINVGLNAMGMVTITPESVIRFNCGGGGGVSVPEPVPGSGSALEFTAANCTSDNCGIASYTVSKTTFTCDDAGQNVVTVTVTDASGNVSTATAIVNVIDTSKPVVKAKNITVELGPDGTVSVTPAQVNNGSSDLCGNLTLSLNKSTFNCDELGNNNVTLIGTDASGNTSTDNAVVTVVDNTAPVVVTQDITVNLNVWGQASIDPKDLLIICDDAVIEEDNGGGGGGFVPGAGNDQPLAEYSLPAVTCTKDNCKITSIIASLQQFDCSHVGTNVVTVTVTDGQGNSTTATANVTVVDPIGPTAIAQDITVDLDASGQAVIDADDIDNGSSDNCNFTKSIDKTSFDCNDIGTNQVVTLTVTDQGGNTAVTTANVTVRDIIAPLALAQDITLTLDLLGQATITAADIDNGSSDNCSFTTAIDQTSFDCNSVGNNTVTLTVTDASGNVSTTTANVTVVENILPVIVPTVLTLDLDANGEASITPDQAYSSITDNCSVVSIDVDQVDFDCDDLGLNNVTVTATDAAGNVATAIALITVRDITPPTVVTKNINVGLNAMGMVTITPESVIRFNCGGGGGVSVPEPVPGSGSALEFTAANCTSDNCGIASYTVSKTTFTCDDAGQNVVTVTVTDASGNVSTATAIVNVIDTSKPVVKAKNITVELGPDGTVSVTPAQVNNGSSDLCGNLTLSLNKSTFNCDELGNNNVTLIGTDASGNTSTDNAVVTVVDNTAPVVVTQDITVNLNVWGQASIDPKDLLIICDDAVIEEDNGGGGGGFVPGAGNDQPLAEYSLPAVTCTKDNCKITSIIASLQQFDCSHVGTNVVTVTVTDGQGNSTTATANVTVVDPIGPTAIAQDITVDLDASGQAVIDADDIDNGSSDNCNFTKSIDKTSFDCNDIGTNQVVTLTVTDQGGNTAVTTVNVTVRDIIAPLALAQDITLTLDLLGQATITAADIDNGSSDNCSFTTAIDQTSFDCNSVGNNTVTLSVTDASGNVSTTTANVTVVENILPVIVPTVLTLDLDANGEASITPDQAYSSITDNCSVVSIDVDQVDFDCDDLGLNNVTVTATDAAGNVATAIALVTVRDITPPTVVTKNINVGLNAMGMVTITPESVIRFNCGGGGGVSVPEPVPGSGSALEFTAANCTSDNCGIASYTVSKTTFTCDDAGQNVVTVTVTDASGNVSTATAIVNVIDTSKPVVKAKNITVELGPDGTVSVTPAQVNNGSSDLCGNLTLSLNKSTFNCDELGNNNVTLIGTDASGNTSTDNAVVTVVDNTAPVVVTQDITVNLNVWGQASIDPKDLLIICDDAVIEEDNGGGGGGFVPGAGNDQPLAEYSLPAVTCTKDNCKITSIIASLQQFDCSHVGTNVVTVTVTDGQGNSTTATANVTVVDPIGPTAIAQDITVDLDASGQAVIDADDIDNGSSDNCNFTKSIDKTSFDCNDIGTNQVVTLTVTDQGGNTAVTTANVTVRDIIAPLALAQDITLTLDLLGQATITAADIDNGSSDNCSFTTAIDQTSFDCNSVGNNTVTLTVTDASGNVSTTTANVTVVENILPVIVPTVLTLDLDANGEASITPDQAYSSITDNCSVVSIDVDQVDFDCDDLGLNNVTVTATDAAGNVATAIALITVRDITPPTVVTKNINVGLNAMGMVTITPESVIRFNCGGGGGVSVPEPVPGSGSALEFTAANCTSDNCGIASYTVSKTTFTCDDAGQNVVTVTVTDASGNVSTATAIVNVIDTSKPVVKAKNITVELGPDGTVSVTPAQVNNGSSDLCGNLTLSLNKSTFNCDELGNNNVTLIGTDASGNTSTDNAVVTVVDNTAPVVVTQDITVNLNVWGQASIDPKDLLIICDDAVIEEDNGGGGGGFVPGAGNDQPLAEYSLPAVTCTKDNCKITSIIASLQQFDCSHVGTNVVTVTVTDGQGNSTTATANVTVVDPIGPTAIAQDITVDLDASGQAVIDADDIDNGSSDNCNFTKSIDKTSFDCNDIGTNQVVTLTVTDQGGNTAVTTANVTVRDIIAPLALAQDITLTLDLLGQATITAADIDNGSSDNCSFTTAIDQTSFDCNSVGNNTVTLSVTDASGNVSTTTANVTVVENTAPTAIAQDITVQLDANGQASITAAQIDNGSSDACGIDTITVDITDFDCSDVGDNTVTITVTDINGQSSTATATVTVTDPVAPVITPQDITVDLDASGQVTISESQVYTSITDNCTVTEVFVGPLSFDCSDIGANTVTIQAADGTGNITSATAIVTVRDNLVPTVIAQDITVNLGANGNVSITTTQVDNGSSDNCDLTLSLDQLDFDCSNVGENTVTLTGTDASGNSASATATVTVIDNNAPVINAQDVTLSLDANGNATLSTSDILTNPTYEECEVTAYQGNSNHAVALRHYYPNNNNWIDFVFDNNGGKLTQYDDGTATVMGTIVNPNDNNDIWEVELNLVDKKNWNEWSALGRSWKGNSNTVGNSYKDWSFYVMDTNPNNPSSLTGLGNNSGKSTEITHMPANYNYGFQVGTAANDKNSNYGMSGWFFYTNYNGDLVQGDFNMDITTCSTFVDAGPCGTAELEVDETQFDCSNLGDNTVTLTLTDVNNNASTKTINVTIVDDIAPTIIAQDVSVTLDANGNASITTAQVDNGSTDNCDLTLSLDQLDFDCSDLGANTVTLTGTDTSGNTASATATVTVVDNTAPVITTQNITVDLDASGQANISQTQVITSVTDNCQVTETVVTQTNFDCSDIGDNTVTVQAADAAGNITTTSVIVTVRDVTAPAVIAQDVTVTLDANGNASITTAQVDNGSTDNCDLTLSLDQLDFNCSDLGTNTVTLTGTDASGNTASATATVTVIDNNAPVITPNNITVALDQNGQASIEASDLVDGAGTECKVDKYGNFQSHALWLSKYFPNNNNAKFHFDNDGGTLTQNADGTATLTGTVANRNDSNDGWIIQLNLTNRRSWDEWSALGRGWKGNATKVGDNYLDWDYYEMDTNPSNPTTLTGFGSNAGKVKTLSHAPASLYYGFQVGQAANDKNTRLGFSGWFTYENDRGQHVQGDFNMDIKSCTTIVDNGACGTATIEVNQTDFDCSNLGDNTISITATNNNGQVTTETVTVTVVDDMAPAVIAQDVTVTLDANGNASITTAQVDNGSTDNCDLTLSLDQLDFDCSNVGANTVTLTGTDASGNTASATATVTVIDNNAPVITPNNITVALDQNGQASIEASDLVDGAGTECKVDKYGNFQSHALWLSKYFPNNNNAKFHFDNDGGTLTQNADGTATLTGTVANRNDSNDGWIIQLNLTNRRSWDEWSALGRGWKGNATKVGDNYLDWDYYEMDTNPSNPTTLTGFGSNAGKVKTLSHAPASLYYGFQVGQAANDKNTRLGFSGWFTYENDRGQHVQGDFNMDIKSCTTIVDNGACGTATIEVNQTDFDCSNLGDNTISITATNNNGQVTTETVTVTVVDDMAPAVIAQDVTVTLDANGNASITTAQVDNGSTDNCDLTLSLDQLDFDCSNVGANTVTLTGTDASGNTASATATVTVIDNNAPVITPNNITVALDQNGQASIEASDLVDGAGTECKVDKYGNFQSHALWLSKYFPNNNNAKFHFDNDGGTLTQNADGTATLTGTVANRNDSNDGWIIQLNLTNRRSWDEWSALGRGWKGNATKVGDNYLDWDYYEMDTNPSNPTTLTGFGSNAGKVKTLSHAPASLYYGFQVGQAANDKNTRLGFSGWFTYENDRGQHVQGDFNMDIKSCTTIVDNGACGTATIEVNQTDFDCSNLGDNTISITATNNNGQVTTETVTVTVVDDMAPAVIAQDVTVTLDANGNASITTAQVDNGSTDNCDLTLSLDQLDFDCSDLGTNTVTLTGTDASGNTASATVTVTVVDNTAPVITGPQTGTNSVQNPTAPAMDFNVFVRNDITFKSNETEGTVAMGGDLTINGNYQVSVNSNGSFQVGNVPVTLVVGGKVNYTGGNALQVNQNGYVKIGDANGSKAWYTDQNGAHSPIRVTAGNSYNSTPRLHLQANAQQLGVSAQNNPVFESNLIDFDAAFTQMEASAVTLSALANNANLTNPNGQPISNTNLPNQVKVNLQDGINVLNVTGTDLNSVSVFTFNNQPSQDRILIINVDQPGNFNWNVYNTGGIGEHVSPYILYNFYNTTFLQVQGNGSVIGTVFAPFAHLNKVSSNNLAGQVIAKSMYQQSGENHWFKFNGNIDTGNTGTIADGSNVTRNTDTENCSYTVQGDEFTPTVSEETCAAVTLGYELSGATAGSGQSLDGVTLNAGVTTITWTAGDSNNNTTFSFTVTVEDNIAPVANASNITVQLDTNGQASITADQVDNGSTDNCDISTMALNQSLFDCSDLGNNSVTLTVTDTNGNTAVTTATITVVDNLGPVIANVPSDIIYQELDNNCGQSISWATPAATDNCQVSLTSSHNPGDTFPVGTTTVTYTATDNSGNKTSATFDITVVVAPLNATLNITQSIDCSDEERGIIDATATGGCGSYNYLWNTGATTAQISNLAAGNYTVTITDDNDNSATASVELSANSTLDVTGTVSPEYPVTNGGEANTIYLGYGEQAVTLTASATGGSAPYSYEWFPENAIGCSSDNSVVVAPQQNTSYMVLVTDANGCTVSEIFDIQVVDVRCETDNNIGAGQANTNNSFGNTSGGYNNNKSKSKDKGGDDDDDDHGSDDDDDDDDDDDNGHDSDDDDDNGGNNGSGNDFDCQCEGRMQNFTFVYNGVSGVTIKAYNKKYTVLIDKYENVQNGDVITVQGFDKHGRLEAKTNLRIGSSFYEIHTSCSINILGETYGPFTITGYTDAEGFSCTLDDDNGGGDNNQGCAAEAAAGGGHALWLSTYSSNGDGQFFFVNNSGSFSQLEDGKAKLTGIVANRHNQNDKWQIEFYFSDAKNWSEWSSLGRSYKDEANVAGNNYLDWTYYIMDQSKATKLTGLGSNAGQVKTLNHKPSDYHLGFQLGEAANNKNTNYGISGWFSYKNFRGQWVQGDINLDLVNCQDANGDCDIDTTPWAGDVSMCLNGQNICIDPDDVDYYHELGATLGACANPNQSLGVGVVNNGLVNSSTQLEVTPEISISAYPNPTRSVANITFSVSEAGAVSVGVYSTSGLLMGTLYKGDVEANTTYKMTFDGTNVTEGVYLIRLRTGGFLETKKLMIKK